MPALLRQQVSNNPRRRSQSRVDLPLLFTAGLGDLGLAAAGATNELGDGADEFTGLDALG